MTIFLKGTWFPEELFRLFFKVSEQISVYVLGGLMLVIYFGLGMWFVSGRRSGAMITKVKRKTTENSASVPAHVRLRTFSRWFSLSLGCSSIFRGIYLKILPAPQCVSQERKTKQIYLKCSLIFPQSTPAALIYLWSFPVKDQVISHIPSWMPHPLARCCVYWGEGTGVYNCTGGRCPGLSSRVQQGWPLWVGAGALLQQDPAGSKGPTAGLDWSSQKCLIEYLWYFWCLFHWRCSWGCIFYCETRFSAPGWGCSVRYSAGLFLDLRKKLGKVQQQMT